MISADKKFFVKTVQGQQVFFKADTTSEYSTGFTNNINNGFVPFLVTPWT